MKLDGRKILITGADGFIGSHLTERLVRAGADVRAFACYNAFGGWGWLDSVGCEITDAVDVVMGDIRDAERVRAAAQDREIVLHLAALIGIPYSYVAARSYVDTNVTGTLNVLEAARETGAHVVHTSTSEVYGSAQRVPMDEEHPISAQSPYAATKIAADHLALSYERSHGLPVSVIRPFNTYGPRQSIRAVIPTIILQLLAGDSEIKLGNVEPTRDFNFVEDIVAGFVAMARTDRAVGHVVNVGSGFDISIRRLVELIAEVVGRPARIAAESHRERPAASEVDRLQAGNALARELLDWTPEYADEDGLRRGLATTVEWFARSENRERYRQRTFAV